MMKPVLLRADNFTPPTRTPWGGRRILEKYKAGLGLPAEEPRVGESWEVSVEPSFPSRLAGSGETLAEVIARDPEAWLGREVSKRFDGQTPLLVKLLDSADNLSVQVHPADGDPALGQDESGKPESWVILDADPGAGLYLGFKEGVDRSDVEQCIATGGALDQLLNFVEVIPGDVFVIKAGSAHAIGKGVTLTEPQFVTPGRQGITYRYWDWNRRYDDRGVLDSMGRPRALHLERSLEVTDWDGPRGQAFVDSCRPGIRIMSKGPALRRLLVGWEWFQVEEWAGAGPLSVPAAGTMWGLVCVAGQAELRSACGDLSLRCGQSAAVPAASGDLTLDLQDARIIATRSIV